MLISKEVEVKWYYKTKEHYINLGYKFTKNGDKFIVPIKHLHPNTTVRIELKCDYCGEEFDRRYADHTYIQNKCLTSKDACKKCNQEKTKDSVRFKYGVDSTFELEEVRNKAKSTFLNKYGVDNPFSAIDIKNKIKNTCLEKYGVEYYMQTDEYRDKVIATCLEKYGVDNVSKDENIKNKIKEVQFEKYGSWYSQTDEYREKYENTCMDRYGVVNSFQMESTKDKIIKYNLKRYGVSHPMKIKNIAIDRAIKGNATKYKLGKGQSSTQQDYLYSIIGGELNYPVDNCLLDIAFLENKMYVECDFSGHDLAVQMGDLTQKQFNLKEVKRNNFLESKGWKRIRIISTKDLLPQEKHKIIEMIEYCKEYLKEHHWINIDIDNLKLICSQGKIDFDFGKLIKINKQYVNKLEEVI